MGETMKAGRAVGIVCTVFGGALGLWVITRLSSVTGRMHAWVPPFAKYEATTLAVAGVAVVLLIIGLIRLTKPKEHSLP